MKKILFCIFAFLLCTFYSVAQTEEFFIRKDSIKKVVQTPAPAPQSDCIKKRAFGLDAGIGSMVEEGLDENLSAIGVGIRAMRNFNSYFGIDYIKFNNIFAVGDIDGINYFSYNAQLMTGVRGYSPAFYKCMSAYAAVRLGYGALYSKASYEGESASGFGHGVCSEFEIGVNLTRTVFVGFSYNLQRGTGKIDGSDDESNIEEGYPMLRVGFNF
jgi:hypothetical protein